MRLLSSLRIVRVALALVVAFWMAGAGCMLGCENMVSASSLTEVTATSPELKGESQASSLTVVAGEACASMHSHDCCARHKAPASKSSRKSAGKSLVKSDTPVLSSARDIVGELGATPSTMMDCPLAINATAALSKTKTDKSSIAVPLTRAIASLAPQPEQATALSPQRLLPNRGHTYLRCCVFLI